MRANAHARSSCSNEDPYRNKRKQLGCVGGWVKLLVVYQIKVNHCRSEISKLTFSALRDVRKMNLCMRELCLLARHSRKSLCKGTQVKACFFFRLHFPRFRGAKVRRIDFRWHQQKLKGSREDLASILTSYATLRLIFDLVKNYRRNLYIINSR